MDPNSLIGTVLKSRYEIRTLSGVGSTAYVYSAFDAIEQRFVAAKVFKNTAQMSDEQKSEMLTEVENARALNHANIIQIYDWNFNGELKYIIMEYLAGPTLQDFIPKQNQAGNIKKWKVALYIVNQILRALQHAHDSGVIHCDIKTTNIKLDFTGNSQIKVKVTDFGISKNIRSGGRDAFGQINGTPNYMSPEQVNGNNELLDNRTDIYSVGVILYELLTGVVPISCDRLVEEYKNTNMEDVKAGKILEITERINNTEPRSPRELDPSIPVGVEEILFRALKKDPALRYNSCSEMLRDIGKLCENPDTVFGYEISTFGPKEAEEPAPAEEVFTETSTENSSEYARPTVTQVPTVNDTADETLDDEYDDDTGVKTHSAVIPILVAVLVLILGVLGYGGYKVYKEYFVVEQIEVPQFIGQKYETVIEKYGEKYHFENQPAYVYTSEYEPGYVCDQSVQAGEKIKATKTILLSVAASGDAETVPDVTNKPFTVASEILKSYGFKIKTEAVEDDTKEEGLIVKTEPEAGTMAPYRSTVTLYVITKGTTAKVPDVLGQTKEMAKDLIESVGLTVRFEDGPSEAGKKGIAIAQSEKKDTEVPIETVIVVTIGTGEPEKKKTTFTITLPKDGDKKAELSYTVDGGTENAGDVYLDGSDLSLEIEGAGKDKALKVYIDGTLYAEGTVDFTAEPPVVTITSVKEWKTSEQNEIPDVEGMDIDDAKAALIAAGYENISVVERETSDYDEGTVIDQAPDVGSDDFTPDTEITLTVAIAPAEDDGGEDEPEDDIDVNMDEDEE